MKMRDMMNLKRDGQPAVSGGRLELKCGGKTPARADSHESRGPTEASAADRRDGWLQTGFRRSSPTNQAECGSFEMVPWWTAVKCAAERRLRHRRV